MSPTNIIQQQLLKRGRSTFATTLGLLTCSTSSAAAWYCYKEHDTRDIDEKELHKAHLSLQQLSSSARIHHHHHHHPIKNDDADADIDADTDVASNHHSQNKKNIIQNHLTNLQDYGVTVIQKVLTKKETQHWDELVSRQIAKDDGTCLVPAGGATGRTHCKLFKRSARIRERDASSRGIIKNELELELDQIYDELANVSYKMMLIHDEKQHDANHHDGVVLGGIRLNDIAQEYFASHGIMSEDQYVLSQLQLLDAAPGSTHQMWHRDNTRAGLTAIIALRDVSSNGPTELILRSHQKGDYRNVLMPQTTLPLDSKDGEGECECECELSLLQQRILLGSISLGDAIVYDSRILHRGRGFGNTLSSSGKKFSHRPVLVLRWDARVTPAPGTGLVGTTLAKWEGKGLALGCVVLDWLGL